MPNLDDLLARSMMFTAAGKHDTIEISGSFAVPRPSIKDEPYDDVDEDLVRIRNNPVWQWRSEPATPGTWREVNCYSRGMGMNYSMPVPVCDVIQWKDVKIVRENGSEIALPLHDSFVVGSRRIVGGKILEGRSSLWPLGARVDASSLVALAYQLDGGKIKPLTRAECDDLGDALIPPANLPPRRLEFPAGPGAADAWVSVGPSRYILLLELVLCKEHDDYAPAGLVGMCRLHPHAMLWSNEPLASFEATLVMQRPSKAMTHGDSSMQEEIGALAVTDCNHPNMPIPLKPPDTTSDTLYDYYVTDAFRTFEGRPISEGFDHPRQKPSEICLADPRHTLPRPVEGGVTRNAGTAPWKDAPEKEPRQGQFDNVHLAPRMRTRFDTAVMTDSGIKSVPVSLDNIVMMFICMHDCLHMHVRWGTHADETYTRGWFGGQPHAKAGAPTVPDNQVVFAKFPKAHVLEYRAVAEGVKAGAMQVLCHHGFGYAIEEWPSVKATALRLLMRGLLETLAEGRAEPFNKEMPFDWATFYWRFRFGGKKGARPVERLFFGDVEKRMR